MVKYNTYEQEKKYRRTPIGMVRKMYYHQRASSKLRNHEMPKYGRSDFISWCFSHHKFNKLYDDWVMSGYEKRLRPSVNRINDYEGYSFDNIELITLGENYDKQFSNIKRGITTSMCKTVEQYTKDGCLVETYHSVAYAIRETGIGNIYGVCSGKRNYAGGYVWKYTDIEAVI